MLNLAPLILAEGLTRRFGDFTAVDHLHVAVYPGEVFGLLGANGARRQERLEEALRLLNLHEHRAVMAGALPLGYQQRLGLAAALLHEPRVLFLIEGEAIRATHQRRFIFRSPILQGG